MKCLEPGCNLESEVTQTRDTAVGAHLAIRRRRECGNGHRHTTYEMSREAIVESLAQLARFSVIREELVKLASEMADTPPPLDIDLTGPAPL